MRVLLKGFSPPVSPVRGDREVLPVVARRGRGVPGRRGGGRGRAHGDERGAELPVRRVELLVRARLNEGTESRLSTRGSSYHLSPMAQPMHSQHW